MSIEDIRAREQKASDEIARLTTNIPGTNWRWSIPANPERDSDLILAASIADVPWLLDENAKLRAALDAVAKLHEEDLFRGHLSNGCKACGNGNNGQGWPCPTVRTITEALG